jgi:5-methylcytosine-specific restriction endonuclease McrA
MKLEKINCEVCGENNKEVLHAHHIVFRSDVNSNNKPNNMAILCSNCHNLLHHNRIKIIGVWPSTKNQGRLLVYVKDGICNFPELEFEEPPFKCENESMKVRSNG